MKGWIILAALAGILYYLYTETDTLDKPIAEAQKMMNTAERKLDAMTGTQIIRVDGTLQQLKQAISQRLSEAELAEFDAVLKDKESLLQFKDEYCIGSSSQHPVFNKDNLQFICDSL